MKSTNTASTASIAAIAFTASTVCINDLTLSAKYSVTKDGDVYVFSCIDEMGIRMHITPSMPVYQSAMDAAKTANAIDKITNIAADAKASVPQYKPESKAKPAAKAAKTEDKPAVEDSTERKVVADSVSFSTNKAGKPVAKRSRKAPAAAKAAEPAVEAAPDAKAAKPEVKAAPAAKAAKAEAKAKPAAKAAKPADGWIGTSITGKGWAIKFDAEMQRTRVTFESSPSEKQLNAVESAGFYFSRQMNSWNKKLSFKAYAAAQELAATLKKI